jgi:arginine decarboxylase
LKRKERRKKAVEKWNIQTTGFVPRKFFLTKGVGYHKEELASFELALRDAKIGQFNLVNVSSIIPPGAKLVSVEDGLKELKAGQIVFCVLSKNSACEKGRIVTASVGLAIPEDENIHGYLSEFHAFGMTKEEAGKRAERIAAYMLATILGYEYDVDEDIIKAKEFLNLNGHKIRTSYISVEAECKQNNEWVTVVSAAVFVL